MLLHFLLLTLHGIRSTSLKNSDIITLLESEIQDEIQI